MNATRPCPSDTKSPGLAPPPVVSPTSVPRFCVWKSYAHSSPPENVKRRRQHVHRLCVLRLDRRAGPELPRLVLVAVVDVVDVAIVAFGKEVAHQIGDAVGLAAAVAAQVQDQRIGAGQQRYRGAVRVADEFRGAEPAHVEIADVARQRSTLAMPKPSRTFSARASATSLALGAA